MKKIMMALGTVAVAAAVHGASVSWNSGAFTELPSCEGIVTYGDVTGTGGATTGACIQMLVWEFSSSTWNTDYTTASKVWDAYKAGTLAAGDAYSGTAVADSYLAPFKVTGGAGWADGGSVYAAVLFLHNDDEDFTSPDYYMANYAVGEATDLGGSVFNLGNTATAGGATAWTSTAPVPEPTSGLLLLLGMAGLALRRKHA